MPETLPSKADTGSDEYQSVLYLTGMTAGEMQTCLGYDQQYRAKQLYKWISGGAADFLLMNNLPKAEREKLKAMFGSVRSSTVSSELSDPDGSLKLQIRLRDGSAVECVLLEDIEGRKTACLSSQVGCPMGCRFCKTGQLGFLRNLGPDEILEQYHFLSERRGFISNVVFMGMGEPLLNLESVRKAILLLTDPEGIGMSHRKITISTSGIVPGIRKLADGGPQVRLAVSLTTARNDLRSELMPVNRSWALPELKDALLYYQEKTGERITLELALLGNRNTEMEDARALAAWMPPLKAQVNLIPWNKIPEMSFTEPDPTQLGTFAKILEDEGITVVTRFHRGRGVMGACGQLGDTLYADPGE
ncbi:MAG: 23S rRNA (adenine(2503)-C(2))-methyltransferase RlmN [Spirochaetaceae bacterium]|nr:23S rRNA (adenine(2503)-C(2))-methyltransferase RlmN [Spirochaetaceae bacterium]